MTQDAQEEEKRQLHKLLREFNANAGMAGFVCGRPVEVMPEDEQARYIGGFCTAQNIAVLKGSIDNLEKARTLDLDDDEVEKLDKAIPTLEGLVQLFSSFMNKEIQLPDLRMEVRKLLEKPIPEAQDGLTDSLSHMIETLDFLSGQDLSTKDNWDTLMDSAQMHDALSRTKRVCDALIECTGTTAQSGAVQETAELASRNIDFLESVFKGETNSELVQDQFKSLATSLQEIWGQKEEA